MQTEDKTVDTVTPLPPDTEPNKIEDSPSQASKDIHANNNIPVELNSKENKNDTKIVTSESVFSEKQQDTSKITSAEIKENIIWNEPQKKSGKISGNKTTKAAPPINVKTSTITAENTAIGKKKPDNNPEALKKDTANTVEKTAALIKEPADLAKIAPTAPAETPVPKEMTANTENKVLEAPKIVPPLPLEENTTKNSVTTTETTAPIKNILKETRIWEGKKGKSLKKILTSWCEEAKIDLVWKSTKAYDLSQNVIISGTLETALKVTFKQALKSPPTYTITKEAMPKLIIE